MTEVQAIILNISFLFSLEDVLEMKTNGQNTAVEDIVINVSKCNMFEEYRIFSWTVPKCVKPDDIVCFMHTKTSKNTIVRLRN